MKKAKYAALPLLLVSALLLSGCTLALNEKEYSRDRLVGISVGLSSSYGAKTGRYEPHEPDGEVIRLNMYTDEEGVTYGGAEYDSDWFEPVRLHVHSKDEGEEYTLETTMYLAEDMLPSQPYLSIERVYEREDGTLYALAGGHNYSGHLDGIGLTISESYSATGADGKKKTSKTTIKLSVAYDVKVVSAEAVEMKGTETELNRHVLTDQEEIWVSADTEWILVEETLADGTVRRSAVNGPLDGETFFVRFANEQGVCVRQTYRLRTPGPLPDETRPS